MYILLLLIKRFDTTDVSVLYSSPSPEPLQDLILSLYEELLYNEFNELLADGYDIEYALSESEITSKAIISAYHIALARMYY